MGRRAVGMGLLLLGLAGCAGRPAERREERGRLGAASEALIFSPKHEFVMVYPPAGEKFEENSPAWRLPWAEVGTKVLVIEDGEPVEKADRRVRVKVLDGKLAGVFCHVGRDELKAPADLK